MLEHQHLTLWATEDIEQEKLGSLSIDDRATLHEILSWSKAFLLNPHPELGRDGPVCPFTKPSITKQLYFIASPLHGSDLSEIQQCVLSYKAWYDTLILEQEETARNFLTFLLPLPEFDRNDASGLDELQGRLKDSFVTQGLMIGQFHPKCEQSGLWNPEFRPLKCAVPLLAIRVMVMYDLPFLLENHQHLDAYLANFAAAIPPRVRGQLVSRMYAPRP